MIEGHRSPPDVGHGASELHTVNVKLFLGTKPVSLFQASLNLDFGVALSVTFSDS